MEDCCPVGQKNVSGFFLTVAMAKKPSQRSKKEKKHFSLKYSLFEHYGIIHWNTIIYIMGNNSKNSGKLA